MNDTTRPPINPERILSLPGSPGFVGWPDRLVYAWATLPVLAIESGGYLDLEVVNPHLGTRMNLANALGDPETETPVTIYDALRELIDAMEQTKFLDQPGN